MCRAKAVRQKMGGDALVALVQATHVAIYAALVSLPPVALVARMEWLCILHAGMCASVLAHWLMNDSDCILTVVECRLRGVEKKEALTQRFLMPLLSTWGGQLWPGLVLWMMFSVAVAARWFHAGPLARAP